MRAIIFSDTHGNYPRAIRVVSKAGPIDLVIHLGDLYEDADLIGRYCALPFLAVPGNCDPGCPEPRTLIADVAGKRLLLTHGDRFGVKGGLSALIRTGIEKQADIILFGHTHQPVVLHENGILIVNPGTLDQRAALQTYALLEITDNIATATIIPADPEE